MLLKLLSLILLSVASIHLANAAALQFDSDDVVNLPLGQTAYPLTGFTWECWAQFSTQNSNICISALDTAWSQDFYLGTTVSNGQKIFFFSVPDDTFNGPVRSVRFIPPGGVVNNRWYHLCGVADYPGNTIKLYIDGELVDSAAWNLTPMSRYMPVAIGKNPGEPGITSFVGKISDVHFWNYPRSSAEIVSGMNTSVTGSETGLIAAYNCDEGSGQIVNDLTANARHGTLGSSNAVESNDPVWSIETRPAYSLLVSPSAFQFNYNVSRPTIAPQTFSVSKSGSGPLNYTISADQPWLTVSPNSGTLSNSSQNIQLTVSPAGLPEGVYSSTVTISASGAISRTVGVTLNVTDPLCVTALSFVPGSTTTSPPANITVSFNRNVNPATVNSSTLRLLRPGPDSVFGTSDDVAVVPDALTVTGSTVDLELSSTQLPNDSYRLILGTEPVALPDLKAHWRLDDPGSTLVDSSGKGNTATATGTLQTPGKYGMARACNGSSAASEFIDLNSQAELNFAAGAPFTICGWIKTTDGFGSIVSFRHSGNDFPVIDINVGYSGAFTSAGRLITLIRDDGGSTGFAQAVGGLVNDGNWHHFAVTRNSGNSISLYLDGAFQQSASGARSGGSITTNLRSLGLERRWMLTGHSTDDNRFINGSIDDVRVYGSQLYLVEIQKLASLSTIADANGNLLDGEINIDFPSGNGAPGGDFIANFILTQPQQSINFPILQDQVYGASPITLAATASSGLPVSYSATGPVVLAGNTLTIIGAGNVTVTASQEGNESFAPAPTVQRSFSVAPASLTIFAADKSKLYGDALPILTAVYSGFVNGDAATDLDVPPTLSTIADETSSVGNYQIIASSASDANYTISFINGTLSIIPASLVIIADNKFKIFGQSNPTFTATYIGFVNGDSVGSLNTPATITTSAGVNSNAGTYAIVVSDASDPNYDVHFVSGVLEVTAASQLITFTSLANRTFGDAPFTLSATGGASGNPVTFAATGPATITENTVTITGAGLVTVRASQAGNGNYLAAPDVDQSFIVNPAAQTINFGVLADKTFGEAAFDVSATGGASGNPVTFAVSGPATVVGSTVTITGAGLVTVTASQAGNANYLAAADVSRAFVVAKAAQTISFGVLADKTFGDAAFDVSATGGASGNPVTFAVSGPATIVGSTVTITGAGLVTVMASQAGSANYLAAADVSRSFAVAKATPVITWANPNDILSGTALSAAQLNASASVAGVFSYSPTFGTVPARGSNQPLNVSFTPSDFVNYNAGAASVSINVLNADPTLSSVSATPNPATTGSAVAFSAAASDIDADSLIYTWDFAEGSKASGPNASHTYSVPGTYAVVLSVSDGQGGTVSSTIPLVVSAPASAPGALDSDGDGFTDAIEAASGSSASSAIETPLGGAKSTNPLPLADAKLKIKLNFSKPGTSDAITLAGTLLLPDGFKLPGSKLLVDVGGVAKSFTLGATGSVKVGNDLAAVKSKGTSARTAKFVVKLSKGNFASTLAPMGLTSADANSTSVNVPLMIILGDVTFVKIHPQIYSAKTGKTGATKDRK